MKITTAVTKQAVEIIKTFTERERGIYDYLLVLFNNTIEKEIGCEKEIALGNLNPVYKSTITKCMEEGFRLSYILQCLDLYVAYDRETKILNIKSRKDK